MGFYCLCSKCVWENLFTVSLVVLKVPEFDSGVTFRLFSAADWHESLINRPSVYIQPHKAHWCGFTRCQSQISRCGCQSASARNAVTKTVITLPLGGGGFRGLGGVSNYERNSVFFCIILPRPRTGVGAEVTVRSFPGCSRRWQRWKAWKAPPPPGSGPDLPPSPALSYTLTWTTAIYWESEGEWRPGRWRLRLVPRLNLPQSSCHAPGFCCSSQVSSPKPVIGAGLRGV